MLLDVKDFYRSIDEKLLKDSLLFAGTLKNINDIEKEIIHHSRKSLLFNNRESWMKKGGKPFDVTIGAYDEAEVCELHLAHHYQPIRQEKHWIISDDGLATFKSISGPQAERKKKISKKSLKKMDSISSSNATSKPLTTST